MIHFVEISSVKEKKTMIYAVCLSLLTVVACSAPEESEVPVEGARSTGMALTMDILDDTDVAGMAYDIVGVDCGSGDPLVPEVRTQIQRDLEDMLIPGGNPALEENPFDANSGHLFADSFFWLDAGCYDVTVQPVTADGEPSEDCASAFQDRVAVIDGETTEITLISQCDNDEAGGLDVIAALNHAPQIEDIAYEPSKFTCTGSTSICVTVSDPDNDPLAIEWDVVGARFVADPPRVDEDGNSIFCAEFFLPEVGDYEVQFTVYDQAYNEEGELVNIEEILEGQSLEPFSRDEAALPIHAQSGEACICTCPEGFTLNEAGDACEIFEEVNAVFNGELLNSCEGDDLSVYGFGGAQFPGGATLQNDFFGQNNAIADGRLNEVGLWACEGDLGGLAGSNPVGEWVGFSRCIEVPEDGEYVVGIAADNRARFRVDGAPVFDLLGSSTANFNYWWMTPVTLSAGVHVIEMEGYNIGSAAAFGAEIYGPFAVGSTVDDASMAALDYENNIIWSTGEQIGQPFVTGATSGYSCPDGFALNTCEREVTCTLFREEACQ